MIDDQLSCIKVNIFTPNRKQSAYPTQKNSGDIRVAFHSEGELIKLLRK
jgi:hypothetical protein